MAVISCKFLVVFLISLLVSLASCASGLDDHYSPSKPLKVLEMMQAHAPWVYFHPDEQYFPSSVLWFFQNGAELHRIGENPVPVINIGDNLPNIGGPDEAFLDLPSSQPEQEIVKKGFLSDAVAYVHAKPALGGTCVDLAIWLYYPFNGGSKFQLGPIDINLGKIGEHVGDWEHITLRIDNNGGNLKAVYLSQHAKGEWLEPEKFELLNGRPVVYASLHGHTHYSTPTSHIHLAGKLDSSQMRMLEDQLQHMNHSFKPIPPAMKNFFGFGVRDDVGKSNNVMDLASAFDISYIDQFDVGMPPWLNYTGRWGPKIVYDFTQEVIYITKDWPKKLRELAIKALHLVPSELLGEEGPQGPKMKDSWSGDERE